MKFTEGNLFHIYNRGNNRQTIFFTQANFLYFLKKIRKYIHPHCEILTFCLMPNHFHFLIYANSKTVSRDDIGRNLTSEGFRHLLSSYTKAINVQEKRVGSLFTQNTHSKKVDNTLNQALNCFMYIHQNPMRSGLVKKMEDWEYSSFRDYCNLRKGTLCNKKLAFDLLNLSEDNFYELSYELIPKDKIREIF
ncbi:MAG: transposase [Bacteroidota bacterium]|nr:transposase [Bacteroidota bacterium]